MATYTYTIFDANPNSASGTAWASHTEEEVEADDNAGARAQVLGIMEVEAAGLDPSDGYDVGDTLYGLVWDADGVSAGQVEYTLTREDLGVDATGQEWIDESSEREREEDKDAIGHYGWDTIASYVATYPSDGEDGACDVRVEIAESEHGVWYLRTDDDAGGSDECDATAYATREAAVEAAEAYAADANEGDVGEDADAYLARKLEDRAGEPCADGEWCVYWETVGDDGHAEERYETEGQAQAACEIANTALRARHPGHLLCGYEVRQLVGGEWVSPESDAA